MAILSPGAMNFGNRFVLLQSGSGRNNEITFFCNLPRTLAVINLICTLRFCFCHLLLFNMRQLKIATQITNRDSQAVEKYLQEISKIPMITPEEETVLAQRIKMGDQKASRINWRSRTCVSWFLLQNSISTRVYR